ncbi:MULTISPECIES: hypothetical protein [Streptomyces]|uniref:Uncharacterized protein n=1 Tax=Streptomyces odorifer TaxID=53450 RepID=A0A7Y6F3D6_9ACTN|nr:hypothetical protein [Streptomyces odorifer]NUV30808.1 hypothetical protein [Streptomyces odorifer]NUV32820.1 hypothetical protein [Streptomyces sp. KAI-27]NUV45697.1 hypothetical protein [Streptomyces sp. CAI-78]
MVYSSALVLPSTETVPQLYERYLTRLLAEYGLHGLIEDASQEVWSRIVQSEDLRTLDGLLHVARIVVRSLASNREDPAGLRPIGPPPFLHRAAGHRSRRRAIGSHAASLPSAA